MARNSFALAADRNSHQGRRIALTQKLRRIIDEAAGYGLALEGISAFDVARSAAAKS
jgi:hypothetical protein